MFAILWTGAFISNIGTWMETIGVGSLVTAATHESLWTGLVAAAGFAPLAVLGPVGGALADRLPRKPPLLTTTTIQTILATTLTVPVATGDPVLGSHRSSAWVASGDGFAGPAARLRTSCPRRADKPSRSRRRSGTSGASSDRHWPGS